MKKLLSLFVVVLGLFSVADAQAFDWFGGRLSVGGGYGYAKPKLPYSFQDQYEAGSMWTAHVKYFLNNDLSVIASYADLHGRSRTTAQDIHFRPLIASLRYNLFHHLPVTPYITAGAGVGFNRLENADGSDTKWTKFALQAGPGFEFFINEHNSIGAEALYHSFVGQNHAVPYRLISVVGMFNVYFGDGPETRRVKEALKTETQRAQTAEQQALSAQQMALAAQQQTQVAQSSATAADQAAAAAAAAKAEADRQAQTLQAQAQQAQAEVDNIKQMIARKDISPVSFETASADLLPDSHAALDKIAAEAKKYPNLKLRVEGHTDGQGGEAYNLTLSQQRADAVRNYLVNTAGLPADQVVAVGFGKTRPIASNDTASGRAQNRRVEFIFFLK